MIVPEQFKISTSLILIISLANTEVGARVLTRTEKNTISINNQDKAAVQLTDENFRQRRTLIDRRPMFIDVGPDGWATHRPDRIWWSESEDRARLDSEARENSGWGWRWPFGLGHSSAPQTTTVNNGDNSNGNHIVVLNILSGWMLLTIEYLQ